MSNYELENRDIVDTIFLNCRLQIFDKDLNKWLMADNVNDEEILNYKKVFLTEENDPGIKFTIKIQRKGQIREETDFKIYRKINPEI